MQETSESLPKSSSADRGQFLRYMRYLHELSESQFSVAGIIKQLPQSLKSQFCRCWSNKDSELVLDCYTRVIKAVVPKYKSTLPECFSLSSLAYQVLKDTSQFSCELLLSFYLQNVLKEIKIRVLVLYVQEQGLVGTLLRNNARIVRTILYCRQCTG